MYTHQFLIPILPVLQTALSQLGFLFLKFPDNVFPLRYGRIGVAEILVETGEINVGQNLLIIGPSTGVIELQPAEIRVDLTATDKAVKGQYCSIAVPQRLRRSDKVYIFE